MSLALCLLLLAAGQVERTQWVMGTALRIVMAEPAEESLFVECFDEATRLDRLLSNYDPDSPLSRVNAAAGEWVEIPIELHDYLVRVRRDVRRSDGAFDPSVGGFSVGGVDAIGFHRVLLDSHPPRARLSTADMRLDPGGDGKGVAVDAIVERLRAARVASALIDFGGSSWYGLGEGTWTVAVVDPLGRALGTVDLQDDALSVSATLRRSGDGEIGRPHILDPRTGEFVTEDRVAIVRSPSATDAEVLSTALLVHGRAGLALLESHFPDCRARIFVDGEPVAGDLPVTAGDGDR